MFVATKYSPLTKKCQVIFEKNISLSFLDFVENFKRNMVNTILGGLSDDKGHFGGATLFIHTSEGVATRGGGEEDPLGRISLIDHL